MAMYTLCTSSQTETMIAGTRVDLSGQLSKLRLAKGLRQREIAERLGVETIAIAMWEAGSPVPGESLQALADALDVPLEVLLRSSRPHSKPVQSGAIPMVTLGFEVAKPRVEAPALSPTARARLAVRADTAKPVATRKFEDGECEEPVEDEPGDVFNEVSAVDGGPTAELTVGSRVDAVLPFVGLLPLAALHRIADETASSILPLELPSSEVRTLLNDVALGDFARAAAGIAFDVLPANEILRRPLYSVVRSLQLVGGRPVATEHLPPTLLTMVRHHTAGHWGALGALHLGDVLEWPGGSAGLAKELLAAAIRCGLVALQAQRDSVEEPLQDHAPGGRTPTDMDLVRAVRAIATWGTAVNGGGSVADALRLAFQAGDLPAEVASARQLLVTAEARSLASNSPAYDPHAALQRVLGSTHARELSILLARLMALVAPLTLSELGDRLGVSRERIRQLEVSGLEKLHAALARPKNQTIATVAQQQAGRLGAGAPVSVLLDSYPDVLENDMSLLSEESIRMRVLLWIAGPYEVHEEWLVRGPYEELVRQTVATLDQVAAAGPAGREEALSTLERLDIAAPYRERWLDHIAGFRTIGNRLVAWRGTLVDKAETILRLHGEPLTKEQLADAVGQASPRAIADRALADARFMRPSLKHIALREWGLDEYSSIEEEMAEEIRRQGGEAEIGHLVDVLTDKFGVSETSVRAYAAGPNFVRTGRGTIRIRTEQDPPPTAPTVEQGKRCYRLTRGWACRLTVTRDVLRGSGIPVPPGFVAHVGVAYLESKAVPSAFGPLNVGWSSLQAWLGSLRGVVEGLEGQLGDFLFVELVPGGELQYTLVRRDELEAAPPAERLALEVGTRLDRWNGDAIAALAHALGLAAGSGRSAAVVRLRLQSRGEQDLLSLLEESASVSQHPTIQEPATRDQLPQLAPPLLGQHNDEVLRELDT